VYQYYEITLQGSETVTLTYKLEQHRPAQVWAGLISNTSIENLRPNLNPWQNFDKNILPKRIEQLESLIDKLNEWLPEQNKIKGKWNYNNHQESVNRLHVHFPEQEKNLTDVRKKTQLSLYNDLIHEIEDLTKHPNESRPHLLICPDNGQQVPIDISDYKHFKASHKFGSLCLHYCHVGRHPFELYSAGDINCPIEQIVPQYDIASYHTLRFYDSPYMEHWHKGKFFEFYKVSTLRHVVDYNDPKMAFGYIQLGQLTTDIPQTDLVDKISGCDKINSWVVY